jgi:aryl-alcohol dehydrogenase-like predicted oxidoreductase
VGSVSTDSGAYRTDSGKARSTPTIRGVQELTDKKRVLGSSGLEVSTVGLGGWVMGGGDWAIGIGPHEPSEAARTIHRAVSAGINWIDTAAVYGFGRSEEVIGRAIGQLPAGDRPYVFTKCGLAWNDADRSAMPTNDLSPQSIPRQCDESIQRLGVDAVDLLQIHWPDPNAEIEEAWSAMLSLRESGKARMVGLSNVDAAALERCERLGHIDTFQPRLSMISRSEAELTIPWCRANRTGVIVYSPLESGLLSGRFSHSRRSQMDQHDFRLQYEDFNEPLLSRNLELQERLRPIAAQHEVSVAAIAIAWVLSWEGVTGAIVGARVPAHVVEWAAARDVALTDSDLTELETAIRETGAGRGPTRPRANGRDAVKGEREAGVLW